MPPITPHDLVQEWEKSGLIEKLRAELLLKYKDSQESEKFASQIREATSQTFSEAVIGSLPLPDLMQHMTQEAIRDSLLEKTIQDSGVLADPNLEAGVRQALERILRRKRMAELRAANQEQLASGATPLRPISGENVQEGQGQQRMISAASSSSTPLPRHPSELSKEEKMDVDTPAT